MNAASAKRMATGAEDRRNGTGSQGFSKGRRSGRMFSGNDGRALAFVALIVKPI